MKMKRNSVFLLLFFSFSCFSQENDFQNWTNIKISKKVYKRTKLTVKEGLRFRENSSLLNKSFTDVKLTHRIRKTDINLSLGYRFSDEFNLALHREYKHRYYFDFSSEYKYKRYKLSIRDRVQYQGNYSSYNKLFRQKFDLSYNVRKTPFEPYVQFEYFVNFDEKFEKLRYTLGFSHPIVKDLDLNLFYRIQKELNVNNPERLFILGSSLRYKL